MKDVKMLGKDMVPRAGVEPARPFGQRILSLPKLVFLSFGQFFPVLVH